ncbi:hypothetical protein NLJ89_g2509 [Agrocybe chaxingu]|uniref:Uncharacterized protein n=1 Tax=Agrocybe chaxingu TaxID=84603 RepID=A0A9W8K762_9AGAR|nr:hypothetical protein NLJ89_g2509 [Agrocybe chaxingu]
MGFFSSRKAEDNNSYQVAIGVGGVAGNNGDKGVVQVIRSRFYGKKGKEREDQVPSFRSGATTAQTLSSSHSPIASSPLASPARGGAGPSILRNPSNRLPPPTPTSVSRKRTIHSEPSTPLVASPRTRDPSGSSPHPQIHGTNANTPASPRKSTTDAVTVTLAQRLNELALANSEGLLNDDEYRLLRQNLFERFATNATVPTEAPVVPVAPARPRPPKGGGTPERAISTRPLSNFQVERPLSITSKTSVTSGMTDLFRRATGRRSASKDMSDNSSIWSSTSNASFFRMPRILTRRTSDSSVRTNAQADAISISSRRIGSDRGHSEKSAARSATGSIRRMNAPPSSFPRSRGHDSPHANTNNLHTVFNEENLTTVQEISQEITSVEAEAKRLMDAFNGLEVTSLARAQRHRVRPSLKTADLLKSNYTESNWGMDSDGRSQRRINLADDAISMRSGTSAGTAPSMSRSAYSAKKTTRSKGTLATPTAFNPSSRPTSLHRKNSTSSVTSDRRPGRTTVAPPVPALPNSITHLKGASSSNISLVKSTAHSHMHTVPEDEKSVTDTNNTLRVDEDYETEMEDIRRRREEVSQRYEARLEYLRAKLKGAQLHEKLMRK